MSIEKEYLDLIEEIKQNDDKLNDWERGFIYGDDSGSTPIGERSQLTAGQKKTIEKIHSERVQGNERSKETNITFNNDRIKAVKLETGSYVITIDENQIGSGISRREAIAVTAWLSENIETLIPSTESSEETGFPGE
jgi:hypothetical protein